MIEHILFIVCDCSSLCCLVFSHIAGSSWCKNCPMFFPKRLQLDIFIYQKKFKKCYNLIKKPYHLVKLKLDSHQKRWPPEDDQNVIKSSWGQFLPQLDPKIREKKTTWETTIKNCIYKDIYVYINLHTQYIYIYIYIYIYV